MIWCLILTLLTLSIDVINSFDASTNSPVKIAIVGGGVGGTSAAYFLSQLIDEKTKGILKYQIDIFEQNSRIGGRVATVNVSGKVFEAGGSIIHIRNKYARDLVKTFGLKRRPDFKYDNDELCIYNGEKFVFCESSWSFMTYLKLFYNYGFDIYRLHKYVVSVMNKFEKIYQLQKQEYAFEQVHDMLEAMDPSLLNLTKLKLQDQLFNKNKLSKRFVNELVQAVTLVNYGQTIQIPSLVGLVAFAGAGEDLWSINGGNKLLPESLAKYSNSHVLFNTKVVAIDYIEDRQFKVHFVRLDVNQPESTIYDYVILATPLTSDNVIRFENFTKQNDLLNNVFEKYHMHQTVATFVKGSPLKQYRNLSIMSCDISSEIKETGSFFTSIAQLSPVEPKVFESKPTGVYKIFSNNPLNPHDLYSLFDDVEYSQQIKWHAYPEYNRVTQPFPPFRIRSGIYYLNAIEWAASAIEMSLIGGKNVALLICRDLKLCHNEAYLNRTHVTNGVKRKVEL